MFRRHGSSSEASPPGSDSRSFYPKSVGWTTVGIGVSDHQVRVYFESKAARFNARVVAVEQSGADHDDELGVRVVKRMGEL